ncbi:MAG: hypothetical protein AAGJ46_10675 [Planctomycetota bacterium]
MFLDDEPLQIDEPVQASLDDLDIATEATIAVPEPAAAAVAACIIGLLALMTVLRYRFDQLSAAPVSTPSQRA